MLTIIPPPGPTGPDFRGCRPLVVEPYQPNRRLLAHILGGIGVGRLETCGTSNEAWRLLAQDVFNVLFLDWSSEMDAPTFLRELRGLSNPHRMLPVVVTTGFIERDYLTRIVAAGANEVALKPYTAEIIAHRLDSLVHGPRVFIHSDDYFGPDRRRRGQRFEGTDRRRHQNWCAMDRRRENKGPPGPERRLGQPGFIPPDRRSVPRSGYH